MTRRGGTGVHAGARLLEAAGGGCSSARSPSGNQDDGVATATSPSREREPRRITVIEDDENIAGLLEVVLRSEGFAPAVVRDGRAALRHVRDGEPPAAVVLDHLLPYCDGFAVASAMRADRRWSEVPILLLRSSSPPPPREARLIDAWLAKPFDPGELVANVRWLVEAAS